MGLTGHHVANVEARRTHLRNGFDASLDPLPRTEQTPGEQDRLDRPGRPPCGQVRGRAVGHDRDLRQRDVLHSQQAFCRHGGVDDDEFRGPRQGIDDSML